MSFKIIRNDITKVKADVIVNTANPNPICASGTDLAIYEAAGKEWKSSNTKIFTVSKNGVIKAGKKKMNCRKRLIIRYVY